MCVEKGCCLQICLHRIVPTGHHVCRMINGLMFFQFLYKHNLYDIKLWHVSILKIHAVSKL